MDAGAGYYQVAYAGKAVEGFETGAHFGAKPGDFGNSPGYQRGLGIVAVSQAVCRSGGESNYIFERTSKFHSQHVRSCVDAEHRAHEYFLKIAGGFQIL